METGHVMTFDEVASYLEGVGFVYVSGAGVYEHATRGVCVDMTEAQIRETARFLVYARPGDGPRWAVHLREVSPPILAAIITAAISQEESHV